MNLDPCTLELPRAQPDFDAMDEAMEWGVEHAKELALLDAAARAKKERQ